MANSTATATAIATATTNVDRVAPKKQPRRPARLQLSQTSSSQSTQVETMSYHQVESPARPYLKLLMPEPPSDLDYTDNKALVRLYNCMLLRGRRNKDWKSYPVFPLGKDDEDDEPLTPLLDLGDSVTNIKRDGVDSKVAVSGDDTMNVDG